jgi:hypothetical protein
MMAVGRMASPSRALIRLLFPRLKAPRITRLKRFSRSFSTRRSRLGVFISGSPDRWISCFSRASRSCRYVCMDLPPTGLKKKLLPAHGQKSSAPRLLVGRLWRTSSPIFIILVPLNPQVKRPEERFRHPGFPHGGKGRNPREHNSGSWSCLCPGAGRGGVDRKG